VRQTLENRKDTSSLFSIYLDKTEKLAAFRIVVVSAFNEAMRAVWTGKNLRRTQEGSSTQRTKNIR
jgi:hypothetical protein